MDIKDLTKKKQRRLLKGNQPHVFLLVFLMFTFQNGIMCSEFEGGDSDRPSKKHKASLKRTRACYENESKEDNDPKTVTDSGQKGQYALEEDVKLVRGKIKKKGKNPPDDYFWHIFYQDNRAGKVFIDLIDEPPLGSHASIQIFLNKRSQGKHIGRVAYSRACTLSHYDVVYASMRKNNIPSFRSAQAAGFKEIKNRAFMQRVMKWVRVIR